MLDNELKINELLNTYVQNVDPKLFQLLRMMTQNVASNTIGVTTVAKSVSTLTTSIANGNLPNSDTVLSLISLRV